MTDADTHPDSDDLENPPPPTASGRPIVFAIAGLIALTIVSWVASQLDIGGAETPIALTIASAKAVIVAIVFMELTHASLVARVVAVTTLAFIALLCAGTVTDVALR
jgi:cytochrome c oxidase subunit 4